ncbi:general secretion pathway protein K [mine drainage metagenome]|uniref:General secretion pathway protein K n=1 Tax=mine drainage metagenome TaxID=410659 RepID=A0A1J5SEM8_9ZZZZ
MAANTQRGFVLVVTLWILAVITIAAAYFAERVGRSIELARQNQQTTEELIAFANTRADVLFRLGTTGVSLYGWGGQDAIALDNRPYRGSGDDIVRLQDNRGLLNVNFPQQDMISRLLGQLGVPIEKRGAMIDTLLDYIDTDDFKRLNGAEAPEYAALGLPPPPNDWLASPYQLNNIIGWRDQPEILEKLLRFVTTSRVTGFNPNTAPPEVLASLPGASLETAAALIKARNEKPFYTVGQLASFTTGALDSDYFLFYPSNSLRITQQSKTLPWAIQYSVTLTPRSQDAPWRVDYYVKTPVPYPIENVDKIQKLPARIPAPPSVGETP